MAYRFKNQAQGFSMMAWVGVAFGSALIGVSQPPRPGSWIWLAASALVHAAYTVALTYANQMSQFSQVYPLSRGLAPVLVASAALLGLGDSLTHHQLASIATIVLGLAIFASVRLEATALSPRAGSMTIAVGCLIAMYTVLDGFGVRTSGSVLGYAGYLAVAHGLLSILILSRREGSTGKGYRDASRWRWPVIGGLCSSGGYATVIWAQQHGALAVVAALRETSILFATLIGAVIFREGASRRRLVASAVVVAGIALLHSG